MDAKPQRIPRVLPIAAGFGDENAVAGKQLVHQRHKSVSTVKSSTLAGGMNAAAKRTVFGDVSNTAHALVDLGPKDLAKARISTLATRDKPKTTDRENNQLGGEAFLRPPQRSIVPSIAPLQSSNLPTGPKPPAHTELPRAENFAKPAAAKKTAFVFADEAKNNWKPKTEDSLKSDNLASTMDKQVKNPRHFKSQPQLRTEQQPVLRRTQSRYLGGNPGALINFDQDLTEAPYHDAMENLAGPLTSAQGQLSTQVAHEADLDQQSTKAEPDDQFNMADQPSGHGFDNDAASVTTDVEENWDEDEEYLEDEQGYTTAQSVKSHGDNTTGGVTTMLAPKFTAKVQRELEIAHAVVQATITEEQIEEEEWDTSMVAEYGEEIFRYMRQLEADGNLCPNPHYMDIQSDLSWSMRSVLMDWLIQVHNRFSLLPETLFLSVNCIDRFLSVKVVSLSKLQLVGATAIFVAAKYEEINCPSVQEIMYMVDGGFTVEEILKAERFMLSMLDFELGWPGPMSFLRRISKADDYDIDTRTLAKYFLEVTIMDERFVASPPSYIAAGAHCLARFILQKGGWTAAHTHYSGYTLLQLKPIVTLIFECCLDPGAHHLAVYNKYQIPKFKHVSVFVRTQIDAGFTLTFEPNMAPSPKRSLLEEFVTSMEYAVAATRHVMQVMG